MKIVFVLILFVSDIYCFAQKINFEYNIGYAYFNLSDIKEFQQELVNVSEFQVKPVITFPNNVYHSILIDFKLDENIYFGVNGAYFSTGARNHLKDYSGEVKTDFYLNAYNIGLNGKYYFLKKSILCLYAQIKIGISLTTLKMSDELFLGKDREYNETYRFASNAAYTEPSIGTKLLVNRNLSFGINWGYNLSQKDDLKNKEDDPQVKFLPHRDGSLVYYDWSGFRINSGLTLSF